jgi:Xaa-Pro aminopeptidase
MDKKIKIEQLQLLMSKEKVDAYLQPSGDAFFSEYPPESAKRLAWLCCFDGSAGTLLVLCTAVDGEQAILFTDGRYTLQASSQLDKRLFQVVDVAEYSPASWLLKHQPEAVLGYDAWLHSHRQVSGWGELKTQPLSHNPIDILWKDQPDQPAEPAFSHDMKYAGELSSSKKERILSMMHSDADALLLTQPDGINWLLNIRGGDIPFNPLALCLAVLARDGRITLISEPREWPELGADVSHVSWQEFQRNTADTFSQFNGLQLDAKATSEAVWQAAQVAGCQIIDAPDPCEAAKAIKNTTEISGIREAHKRDGRALSKFLAWLDAQETFSELQAVEKIEAFRRAESGDLYRGPSFDTISGSGPNGAIVHYRVTPESNRSIGRGELYLVDSGGQYPDGTTDVTRTIVHGEPSPEMIDRYTRVLKGHIALARAVFPEGTTGAQLDALARHSLWEIGEDYAHGTGHGVGAYLCVHEGPQGISRRASAVALEEGMILSNEPGYYKTGEYGIRIENLVLVRKASQEGFLCFETLTLAPMDTRLINTNLLSSDECAWLAHYEAQVIENKY